METAIVVHGGCGRVEESSLEERRAGVRQAAERGWEILRAGGSALDAAEAAVVVLEDLPVFNAGRGSALTRDGRIEMDAAIMDGATRRAGAVACVSTIAHPIQLARRVMEASPHVLLCGAGAEAFAVEQGLPGCDWRELVVADRRRQWEREHGTVGAVALDARGGLAAATSTGGTSGKLPGRIGDTPIIGAGTYADQAAAVSCTGTGESILRMTLARMAALWWERLREAQAAAERALAELAAEVGGEAGLILVDRGGGFAIAQNTPHMPVCAIHAGGIVVRRHASGS